MHEDVLLRTLPLADRLRIAAVDLAVTGAPRALVQAVWQATELINPSGDRPQREMQHTHLAPSLGIRTGPFH
jgi:hypothetical protein